MNSNPARALCAPPRFSNYALRLALCAALPFAWLALVWLPSGFPSPDLDASWRTVLAYAASHRWHWGSELVFTFGPLGYLYAPIYTREHWGACLAFSSVHALLYLCLLGRVSAAFPTIQSRIIFCLLGVLMPSLSSDSMFLLSSAFTGLLLCREDRRDFGLGVVGIALAATASAIKVTFLLQSCFMLSCFALHCLLHRHGRRAAIGALLFLALGFVVWSLVAGQPISALPAYIGRSLEITAAYGEAMGVLAPRDTLISGCAVLCLTGGTIIAAYLKNQLWREVAPSLLLLGTLFLGWKQGFNRGDYLHTPEFFALALPILVLAAGSLRREASPPAHSSNAILVSALAITGWGALSNCLSTTDSIGDKVRWLADARSGAEGFDRQAKLEAKDHELPKIKQAVGAHSVDVAGWEQAYAVLNGLNYHPAPVFQAYQAATRGLIDLNTAFYQSKQAPDFVLFEMQTIDNRFPTLDNALVLPELVQSYEPLLAESPFLLLRRRSAPPAPAAKTFYAAGEMEAGDRISLPPGLVWCELDLHQSLVGKLYRFFLHTPVITLETEPSGQDEPGGWRLIPANARAGFLVSPLVQSNRDFLGLFEGKGASVKSIRIRPERLLHWVMQPKINYRIYQLELSRSDDGSEARSRIQAIRAEMDAEEAEDAALK